MTADYDRRYLALGIPVEAQEANRDADERYNPDGYGCVHAIVGAAVITFGPASVLWLTLHHRPVAAMVMFGLIVCYCVARIVAWELRDHARAREARAAQHAKAGPLLDVTYPREWDRWAS